LRLGPTPKARAPTIEKDNILWRRRI